MAYPKSVYGHTIDFGRQISLAQIAIEVPYPMSIFIKVDDNSEFQELKIDNNCTYELTDIAIRLITIGTQSEEKGLVTYITK